MAVKSLVHLNNHLLCAIDIETTGLDPDVHEILQLAILPLDNNLYIRKDLPHFDIYMKPNRPQKIDQKAMTVNNVRLSDIMTSGIDQFAAFELFEHWFQKLRLMEGKRIVPLAYNWPFEAGFLREWMGHENFNHYIDGHYRCAMQAVNFVNDRADFSGAQCPFPKRSLSEVCKVAQVEVLHNVHDALYDSMLTASLYRKLLTEFFE